MPPALPLDRRMLWVWITRWGDRVWTGRPGRGDPSWGPRDLSRVDAREAFTTHTRGPASEKHRGSAPRCSRSPPVDGSALIPCLAPRCRPAMRGRARPVVPWVCGPCLPPLDGTQRASRDPGLSLTVARARSLSGIRGRVSPRGPSPEHAHARTAVPAVDEMPPLTGSRGDLSGTSSARRGGVRGRRCGEGPRDPQARFPLPVAGRVQEVCSALTVCLVPDAPENRCAHAHARRVCRGGRRGAARRWWLGGAGLPSPASGRGPAACGGCVPGPAGPACGPLPGSARGDPGCAAPTPVLRTGRPAPAMSWSAALVVLASLSSPPVLVGFPYRGELTRVPREHRSDPRVSARQILDDRLAHGEIDAQEYQRRTAELP